MATQASRHLRLARRRRSNAAAVVVMAIGGALLLGALALALIPPAEANEQAPNFTAPALDGSTLTLADYRGKTVILNFWASWCPPCRAEMPGLYQYYREHQDEGLVMIAVNVGESRDIAEAFIQENGFDFPVALDPYSEVADQFGISSLPVTVVIGQDGEIKYQHLGLITRDVLDPQVRPLLGS